MLVIFCRCFFNINSCLDSEIWHMLQEEARWVNKDVPGICPFDTVEKKPHLISKTFESFSSMHSIVFGIQWDYFPPQQAYFPKFVFAAAYLLSFCMNECCSVWGHNIWPVLCVQTHFSVWPTVWEQLPHCSLTRPSSQDTALGSSVCCCCASLHFCSASFAQVVRKFKVVVEGSVK